MNSYDWNTKYLGSPEAMFKLTLPEKSVVDGGAIRCQHVLVFYLTCGHHSDLLWILSSPSIPLVEFSR